MTPRKIRRFILPALALCCLAAAAPQILTDVPTSLVYPPFWHTPLGIHRGTQDLLTAFTGARARFADPEGLACTRLLSEPPAGADDCRVTVIGANSGQANLIYNPSMTQLEVLGDRAAGRGLFRRPAGVALFSDGTAYVADPGLKRVVRLRLRAKTLQPDGELEPPPGGWGEPWGAAFDSQKRLYVSDAARNQIFVFSPEGRRLRAYGPDLGGVSLQAPRALAVADAAETWSFYRDDYLYVSDRQGRRLLRVGLRPGAPPAPARFEAAALPAAETPAGFAWLALDYYENLWVTDPARCQIHKFDRHLRYLTSYGNPGKGDGRFQRPAGIAVFRHFGQVFVAEQQAAHYFWIGADCLEPSAARLPAGGLLLRCFLTEPASLSVTAAVEGSGRETPVFRSQWLPSGPFSYSWRCPPELRGKSLRFSFTVEATYSSARYFAKRVTCKLREK